MSNRIRQLILSGILFCGRIIRGVVQSLWWLLTVLAEPFIDALLFVLRPVVIWLYSQYLKLYTRLRRSAFMQNKVLFIFGNKYFIHVIVVTLALFVTSTNLLQAKEYYNSQFGTHSGLYRIVSNNTELDSGQEVVEQGLPHPHTSYINKHGVLVANIPVLDPNSKPPQTIGDQLRTVGTQAALVSNSTIQTANGIRSGITHYTVREGDTISDIANRFGISVNTILLANGLTTSSYIKPGNSLKILPTSGIAYTIAAGDTLEKIIAKYKGDLDTTIQVNDIGSDHMIPVGKEIVIAGGTPPPPPTPPQNSYISNVANNSGSSSGSYVSRNLPSYVTGGKLNWPVGCHNTPTTYWGHPNHARDIPCPYGTPIYAAESGTVTISFTGQWGHGYGNAIDLHSAGGLMTRYAHMSTFNVSNGQTVSRGQVIGFVGLTGRTSGPHVHFEVWLNGVSYDPINFIR